VAFGGFIIIGIGEGYEKDTAVFDARSIRARWPMVAIVGRPNVGKSSLFNRLIGRRQAIVSDVPGTTRDRISGEVRWEDRIFVLVDTGGLEVRPESSLWEKVRFQVEAAVHEADVMVFVIDVTQGVMPEDFAVADMLRKSGKPVIVVANKVDGSAREMQVPAMYELGIQDELLAISAYHNRGIGELLDRIIDCMPVTKDEEIVETDTLHLAIVGRPNVGKSMLANAILGEERAIVSEIPGTTRDALDTAMLYRDQPVVLIDTAGIRRRGRVEPGIEKFSVLRSMRAIARADVALFVLDVTDLVAAQDTHIAGFVLDTYKGIVVVVNKWDLADQMGLDQSHVRDYVLQRLKFISYAPVRFASALDAEGIEEILDVALEVYKERHITVSRAQLEKIVLRAVADHAPPRFGKSALRIHRVVQESVDPPTFVFYVNSAKYLHFSYERYLENALRRELGFRRTPLKLEFRGRPRQSIQKGAKQQ
jgi:GTP-binding protein